MSTPLDYECNSHMICSLQGSLRQAYCPGDLRSAQSALALSRVIFGVKPALHWGYSWRPNATLVGLRQFFLQPPRQLFLPQQLHHRVLPGHLAARVAGDLAGFDAATPHLLPPSDVRSEEHTSELQSLRHLVCRLLLE